MLRLLRLRGRFGHGFLRLTFHGPIVQDEGSSGRAPEAEDEFTGTPRWVKVSAAILVVALVLFLLLHLAGGGFGNHAPPAGGAPP